MPQRFLRPGITNSDAWNSVSFEAQSLYIRILTLVDDFGRYDGRVPVLHGQCFALRPEIKAQRTAGFRSELQAAGLIDVYAVDGKDFLQITKWSERARGDKSKYPDKPTLTESADIPQDSAAERSVAQRKDASTTSSPLHPIPSPSTIAIGSDGPEPAQVVAAWNATSLPKVQTVTDARKAALKSRLSEPFFRDNWRAALAKIAASDFCHGRTERGGWKASFEWFVTPDAAVKAMEGKYDNKHAKSAGIRENIQPIIYRSEDE